MCGIVGLVNREGRLDSPENAALLSRMCRLIAHRGPDDQGLALHPRWALGMRRLSIIDVAGGHQPMTSQSGQTTIVFNGEIYNYLELHKDLATRGHRFATRSDTETILCAYEEYGADCVQHLRGMFAFAIWDEPRQRLFLARDRVGKKPLYYTLTPQGTLIFASELKSLLLHPEVRREMNWDAFDAYVSFGYVPDPLCIFRNIHKLPPGCHLTFEDGTLRTEEYWDFKFAPVEPASEEICVAELRQLLADAVRLRLRSDVPLGAFLSGGLDSSAIVGLMTQVLDQPVKTFSIGFHEDSYNELEHARLVARHFGTEHHEFIVTPQICDVVDELAWHFDEPFADSSAIPTYMVSKLAREHVTVALTGDGGDELFAGYIRYAPQYWHSRLGRLPRAVREKVLQPLGRFLPAGAWGRNYIHDAAFGPLERYVENVACFSQLNKYSLYTEGLRRQTPCLSSAPGRFGEYAQRVQTGHDTDALLYLDSKTYLPGDILTKVDRVSMAVSLEIRNPLLDQELIEFVTRLPARLKLNGTEAKFIFKQAVKDFVPPVILQRPKQGFGLPLDLWIKQQLRERVQETLTEPRTQQRGYFDPRFVRLLLDEHARGRRDHTLKLWTLFMLELWHREFWDGESPTSQKVVSGQW